ncbi:hypothetical protein Y11_27321 [Yersinia enterocolitica subsp. palearctica Y11]|uniref:Uncharacterized protein n=1 Tax=Yersinia enterocolitica subsp. palearctica serotype O:3 (strain DSM 13030 / CIP 106945 / Y11) TaxID=930944 RepID=A0A0H3NK43_YERE1|nr:hypothetical protein Y11_27321 [Yersinia enterocolitica subsp. palearctica Y11]CCO69821.1 hypothetical protein D322_2964 [Yersinia enterocolitica IP 10393]
MPIPMNKINSILPMRVLNIAIIIYPNAILCVVICAGKNKGS